MRPTALALVVFVAILVGGPAAPVAPTHLGAPATDAAQQLAERFAPIIMLKQQSEACDPHGEPTSESRRNRPRQSRRSRRASSATPTLS